MLRQERERLRSLGSDDRLDPVLTEELAKELGELAVVFDEERLHHQVINATAFRPPPVAGKAGLLR